MLLGVSAPPSVSRAKSASSAKMWKLPQCRAFLKEIRWSTESDELLAALIIVKSRNWKMIAWRMNSVFLHPAHMWFSMADCSRRWKTLRRKLKKGIIGAHGMSLEFIQTGFDHVLGSELAGQARKHVPAVWSRRSYGSSRLSLPWAARPRSCFPWRA